MHDDERYGCKQETVAEAVARLAPLGHVEFDQVKDVEAAKLGCTPSALKKDWEAARRRARSDKTELFTPIEPWSEPVDGATLLDEIVAIIVRHVVLPSGAADAVALWTLHAHAHDTADISPILTFKSPLEECGKSTALTGLVAPMVPRPLTGSNITSSVVFRAIEKWHPTLILDEADTYIRDNEELRGVLDSGHSRRTAYVLRNVGEGVNMEPQCFSTWAPKAVGLIGDMPRTLTSRSITILMRRMTMADTIEPIPVDGLDLSGVVSRAARWARDNAAALRVARPDMPASLVGRRADNWKHLLAIANLCGGEWPVRARNAAETLSARGSNTAAGIMLLEDIKAIFDGTKHSDLSDDKAIFSKDLVAQLVALEERPWAAFGKRGREITQAQVAKMLGDFEINSGTVRIGSQTAKGYYLRNFSDAFARYLPRVPAAGGVTSVTASQTTGNCEKSDVRNVTHIQCVTLGNRQKPAENMGCDGVTAGAPLTEANGAGPELEYEQEERQAIQNEPPLSPETREANRFMGDFPPEYDRRASRMAKGGT